MYDSWLVDLPDALHGTLPPRARIEHSTSYLDADPSPDGARLYIRRSVGAGEHGVRHVVRNVATGAETTLNLTGGESGSVGWVDTTTVAVLTRSASGIRLGLMSALTGSTRDWFDVPDSAIRDAAYLKGGGWAWIPRGSRAIAVQRPGESKPRRYPLPAWFDQALGLTASTDGRFVAFRGWKAPEEDSLGVGVLTLADGTISQWYAMFAVGLVVETLADGGIAVIAAETEQTRTIYRLRGPGQAERLGTIPRPIASFQLSQNGRNAAIVTREYHGDVWMSSVIRH